MKFGNRNIYNIVSFSRVFTITQHQCLRYCDRCVEYDTKTYGEPYWHRVHQLPGVFFCPIHNMSTTMSTFNLSDLYNNYYVVTPLPDKTTQLFESNVSVRLLRFAKDTTWLLQHGNELGSSEHTTELYDNWLRVKKYRDHTGKLNHRRLKAAGSGWAAKAA